MNAATRKRMGSSAFAGWCTPNSVLKLVRKFFGGHIDLDPCSGSLSSVAAYKAFTEKDDGLAQEWRGRTFMNPPYGRGMPEWLAKAMYSGDARSRAITVGLIPARVDAEYFHEFIWRGASAVCFPQGRITFIDPRKLRRWQLNRRKSAAWKAKRVSDAYEHPEKYFDPAFFPSALPLWGAKPREVARFKRVFGAIGKVIEL